MPNFTAITSKDIINPNNTPIAENKSSTPTEPYAAIREFEKNHLQTMARIEKIKQIFAAINLHLENISKTESVMHETYAHLRHALGEFQNELLGEAANRPKQGVDPVDIAKKLQDTYFNVFNMGLSLEVKNHSINEFKYAARNARLSLKTKALVGAIIGTLLSIAVFLPLVITIGPMMLIPLAISASLNALFLASRIVGSAEDNNQYENRGKEVCGSLKALVAERNKLFQSKPAEKFSYPEKHLTPVPAMR
jgi:hypothetical protein